MGMKAEMTRRAGAGVWTQKPGRPHLDGSPAVEGRGGVVSSGGQGLLCVRRIPWAQMQDDRGMEGEAGDREARRRLLSSPGF